MGCLNSSQKFKHVFGNIHLSGPCNRACYFCIGQHMMALDAENNLGEWPLKGIDSFVEECILAGVTEIYVTGTNTDPLMYQHTAELKEYLLRRIPELVFGIRTNGAMHTSPKFEHYDKGSITICSLNPEIHTKMMGKGSPADLEYIVKKWGNKFKVNIVLGPEQDMADICQTLMKCMALGIKSVNLREPYGQPHVGNPLRDYIQTGEVYGMPVYSMVNDMNVVYWDVHYCEVESINLYANGRISHDYPISRGHDAEGIVLKQSNFEHGRHNEQWVKIKKD